MHALIKWFGALCLIIQLSRAGQLNVPSEYATIQTAIDSAQNGDTVLVANGTYTENIDFKGKSIVVGSLFLTTGDQEHIRNTIIDGGGSGSVVYINESDSLTELNGFTLTNGNSDMGGGIQILNSSPTLSNLRIIRNSAYDGGGIASNGSGFKLLNSVVNNNYAEVFGGGIKCDFGSTPYLENVKISDNTAVGVGGGGDFRSSQPTFKNVTITGNKVYFNFGGGISIGPVAFFDPQYPCNIYNNIAGRGSDIDYYGNQPPEFTLYVDTFTVVNPTDFHLFGVDKFNILHGKIEQADYDLYVSPNGSDENGGASASDPLKTISHALSKIKADSHNPRTIYIAEGLYSPTNGDHFPLNMVSYVSLEGDSSENVVLNAEKLSPLLRFQDDSNVTVKNMMLTHGFSFEGGAVTVTNCSPTFHKIALTDNQSLSSGGAMVVYRYSHPIMENCTISNNTGSGGGITLYESCLSLINTILWDNNPAEVYFWRQNYDESCLEVLYTDVMEGMNKINTNNNGTVDWQEGNLDLNPLFCDTENFFYTLAEESPVLGAGQNGTNMGAFSAGCKISYVSKGENLPEKFILNANYPNPFNPNTTFSFELAKATRVILSVYDVRGRLVDKLVNERRMPGYYSISWNADELSSGIYFYRLQTDFYTATGKCLLLK